MIQSFSESLDLNFLWETTGQGLCVCRPAGFSSHLVDSLSATPSTCHGRESLVLHKYFPEPIDIPASCPLK